MGEFEVPLGLYLQPCPSRDIVARMLHNLKEIHRTSEDWLRLLAVQERLVRLLPDVWDERRDRGLVLAELGENVRAAQDLTDYLVRQPEASDHAAISARLGELRQD